MMSVQRAVSASEVPLRAKQGTVKEQTVGQQGEGNAFKKTKKHSLPCFFISTFSLICSISISLLPDIVYC